MKKLILVFVLLFVIACSKLDKEPCEESNTGWVTIHNNLGKTITVDIYSDQFSGIKNCFMGPKRVLDDSTVVYSDVPMGLIEIWWDDLSSGWEYWKVDNQNHLLFVTNCKTLEFETY